MARALRIGTAGWSYRDWNGVVYPHPCPEEFDPLRRLSQMFDQVEVNATFYRYFEPSTAVDWVERIEGVPEFRFSVKAHQDFTHGSLGDTAKAGRLLDFLQPILQAGRLNALLLQFPWSFRRNESGLQRLDRLARQFRDLPLVAEFRHASWDTPEMRSRLHGMGVALCAVDMPEASGSFRSGPHVTGPLAYMRIHGRNRSAWFDSEAGRDDRYDYSYAEEELEQLAGWIEAMHSAAEETCVIGNNHFRGQAVVAALILKHKLLDVRPPAPASLVRAFPVLAPHVTLMEEERSSSRQGGLFD